ncbi:hypothetical protein FACS189472_13230 [Alphaproteobacteria bacterium]|nr:hypothetical protein FACS189472_13230 [Alphaproteobacteria bacterium]
MHFSVEWAYIKDKDGVYLAANINAALLAGVDSVDELIGKTDHDLFPKEQADKFRENDINVIENRIEYSIEEVSLLQSGDKLVQLSTKKPLIDKNGEVINVLGITVDITDRQRAKELQFQNKIQETKIEHQKDFRIFTAQVLHDVISPLSSLESIIKSRDIPEEHHVALKNVATSIRNIVSALSTKYREYERESNVTQEGLILVALALEDVVRSKKYQYKDSEVKFNCSFDPAHKFTFIKCDQSSFERMVSNLINNSVEALKAKQGNVDILFCIENKYAKIIIEDNGVGMPKAVIDKIKQHSLHIDSTKHAEEGIGLSQVLTAVDFYNGIIEIESKKNVGTTFSIKFPIVDCPQWIAKRLTFKKGDTVVILDDDPSVFSTFENLLKDYSENLKLKFFSKSGDALNFIESFREKEKLFFLSDYELRGGDFNGLTVILQSGAKKERSIIVTSIHGDRTIHEMAERSNVKVLPKQFLLDTQITIE